MKFSWKVYWPWFLLIPFVIAGVVGWFLLPPELVIASEEGRTMPKLFGLLFPVALAALGSGQVCLERRRRVVGGIILLVAISAEVMLFVWNL